MPAKQTTKKTTKQISKPVAAPVEAAAPVDWALRFRILLHLDFVKGYLVSA